MARNRPRPLGTHHQHSIEQLQLAISDQAVPALLPLDGGPDAIDPGRALVDLMALPAWSALREWSQPLRRIAVRGAARRLTAGLTAEQALWGGITDAGLYAATHRHGRRLG
jgi:hypothetical protein